MNEMDEVTQQNATLVEEASATAASLEEQASELAQLVKVFKLDGHAGPAAHARGRRGALPAAPVLALP